MKTSLVLMMVSAMCVGAAADEAKVQPATKALPAGWVTPQQKEAEKKARELKEQEDKREHDRVMANIDRQAAEVSAAWAAEKARAQAANPAPVVSVVTTPVQTPAMDSMSERQKHDRKTTELLERQNERLQAEALERIANELELRRLQGR
jgi:hypothetical protein